VDNAMMTLRTCVYVLFALSIELGFDARFELNFECVIIYLPLIDVLQTGVAGLH
jgi:hypothetical protein